MEEDRLAKLTEWLNRHGCINRSDDIPDYEYTTDENGGIILTKYIGDEKKVVIPDSGGGHPVVKLDGTFRDCKKVKAVTIPDSVTDVDDDTFKGCEKLTELTLSKNLKSFFNPSRCYKLRKIIVRGSRTMIRIYGKKVTIYCPVDSEAWKYCEREKIKHKPLETDSTE